MEPTAGYRDAPAVGTSPVAHNHVATLPPDVETLPVYQFPALALLVVAVNYVLPMVAGMPFRGLAWRPNLEDGRLNSCGMAPADRSGLAWHYAQEQFRRLVSRVLHCGVLPHARRHAFPARSRYRPHGPPPCPPGFSPDQRAKPRDEVPQLGRRDWYVGESDRRDPSLLTDHHYLNLATFRKRSVPGSTPARVVVGCSLTWCRATLGRDPAPTVGAQRMET